MRIAIRGWLVLVLLWAAFAADADDRAVYDASIIRIIAAPKEYDHKTVRVMGFLNIEFEGDAIYFHEEDFRRGLINNGLGIRAEPEIRRRLEKLSGQYVILEGVVDASFADEVAVAGFRIALTRITRADPWKWPSPSPSP